MPRAIWSGSISFGLVNVPVKLYSATRDHKVHFHQVDKKSGSRIRYEKVAEKTGKEVDADDIQLGYEMSKGQLVTVDPAELEELRPRTTRTIDIADFVDLSEIDPVFYNRTYWLAPDGEAASRAYRLLGDAMEDRRRAGIGTVVMRNRQYLAAIRPRESALALSTMRFADEVVDVKDIEGLPHRSVKVVPKEKALAAEIIDSLASPWKPEKYHDTYTEEVKELVAAHQKGRDIVVEEEPAAQADVVDLMQALESSLESARSRSSGQSPKVEPRKTPRSPPIGGAPDSGGDVQAGSWSSVSAIVNGSSRGGLIPLRRSWVRRSAIRFRVHWEMPALSEKNFNRRRESSSSLLSPSDSGVSICQPRLFSTAPF